MSAPDHLVSRRICCASAFERHRLGNLYCLYRRPFSFSQDHYHIAEGDVRLRVCLSTGAGSDQATPDSLRPLCSATS
jgi:hypothetical protein